MLSEEQAMERNERAKNLEYYNRFEENNKKRAERVRNHDVSDWNINLNRLAVEYVGEFYKTQYFTKFLNKVDKQLAVVKIMELVTGKDLSNQFQTLTDSVKIKVYNSNITDEEDEDLLRFTGGLKHLASLTKIAIRPGIFMKEMLLGRIRNTSTILTKNIVNDNNITMENLRHGTAIAFGLDKFGLNDDQKAIDTGPGDYWFANLINNTYLINDRDINILGEQFTYDRYGTANWGSRMLYLNTVQPDWFNRMAIFLAKMDADGTLDAHSRDKNGNLVYDIAKDKRFSYFWEFRKNPDGAVDKKKFMEQKSLYKLKMR
ncbi:MAG: hypothetical protein Q4C49_00670 [Bacillota bacterium]|nr:hypothetical protein [Bacillota bacterium]